MKRLVIVSLLALTACGEDPAAPVPCGALPEVTVNAGEQSNATACFTDANGDMLSYTATSSNPAVATASISGTSITVRGVAPGNTSVTVTATDPGGLQAQQNLQVTVPNRAPQPRGSMPPVTVPAGQSNPVDASSYFTEPDGETLAYTAASSDPSVASLAVSGSTVTVTAVAKGTASVTVTATDPGGLSATQMFQATVPNRAPEAGDPIPDIEVDPDTEEAVDVSVYFTDPDGDRLTYSARSSDTAAVKVSPSGSPVTITAVAQGTADVTVTARDPEGASAVQTFEVTVANRAPVPVGTIPDMELSANDEEDVDVDGYFTDPDGDRLTFAAEPSTDKVRVSVSGSVVTVTGVAKGTATVTVTARDPGGLTAEQRFQVTVANRAPVPVGTIPDRRVVENDTGVVDVDTFFTDPDGDRLTHEAVSSDEDIARVTVSGTRVTITAVAKGTTEITVTASDPYQASADQTFEVTVVTVDRAVLEELYDSLGGSNWTTDTNWKTDARLNTWHGVTTNSDERVVRLELRENGLTGSIPASIGRLRTLEAVDLSDNRVAPSPSEGPQAMPGVSLDDDAGFRHHALPERPARGGGAGHVDPHRLSGGGSISLQSTGISGPIPREVGNLSNLDYLDLRRNSLTGAIPSTLTNLRNLEVLELAFNSLTGPIPSGLGNLSNLRWLSLVSNSLTGPIPGELGSLSNLEFLSLARNSLTGPMPSELGNLSNLDRLFLSENDSLSGPLPLALDGLTLDWFTYNTTNLCVPEEPTFRAWLDGIPNHQGTGVDCLRRLTDNSASDRRSKWNHAGNGIAFESDRDGNWEIYSMDDDGSNQRNRTNNGGWDLRPEWNHDGTRIAFESSRDGSDLEIYVMDDDGGNLDRLTNNSVADVRPEWNHDGTRIAFESSGEIYVMDDDGGNLDRLTNNSASDWRPEWNDDGTRIAFISNRDNNWEIYAMDEDGGNLDRLTDNNAGDIGPRWSPDGTRIAFHSERDGNLEIYMMDANGSNQTRLTNNSASDRGPQWSPDGTLISFRSNRDGNWEIYVIQVK